MLPTVVEAVGGHVEVDLDGVRLWTGVLEALALGERAVLVGRPVLWGLAVDGAAGVGDMLGLLREELELAMMLAGVPDLGSLDRDLI